jgi:sensor histidine kinase regulating citrate/malate metabolism
VEISVNRGSRLRALPAVLTDLETITILGNLLQNATEAAGQMPTRRRRVSVRISDRGGELLIRVRDWGPGIPPERVASIFRSGYSTKGDHVGLGLGLVQTIVSRAGGRIDVEHPSGGGVAIAVRIPFA